MAATVVATVAGAVATVAGAAVRSPAYGGGYYGDWYNGCWNHGDWGGFWAGMGVECSRTGGSVALTTPSYAYSYGMSSYFPTWGAYDYSTWGLESFASPWLYEDYANPGTRQQSTTIVQPVPVPADTAAVTATAAAYDYSKPIAALEPPPEPGAVDTGAGLLTAPRRASGRATQSLTLADQALAQTPNDPILHEFRALRCSRQLLQGVGRDGVRRPHGRARLNWATMASASIRTSTRITASVRPRGQREAGAEQALPSDSCSHTTTWCRDTATRPRTNSRTSSNLSRRISSPRGSPRPRCHGSRAAEAPQRSFRGRGHRRARPIDLAQAEVGDNPGARPEGEFRTAEDAPAAGTAAEPARPRLAKPNEKTSIALLRSPDGTFTWTVTQAGKSQSLQGQAGYQDQILTLAQETGPPFWSVKSRSTRRGIDLRSNRYRVILKQVAGLSLRRRLLRRHRRTAGNRSRAVGDHRIAKIASGPEI